MFLSSRGRFLHRHRLFFIPPPPGLQAHISCISQGYASAGLYPARFSSALTHSTLRLHDGTPSSLHTARIRTGHDSGTASPPAHSTLSPPAPVYPSPALYTPAAASLPPPRLARNLKYLTILKNVSGMCCFSLATSSRCVSLSVAVSPVLWSR